MENKLNKKYQYGWYGTCDEECKSKFLDSYVDRKYIESIIRVSLYDGKSFEKFTAYDPESHGWVDNLPEGQTFDDYINPEFKHLECGMGYLVVRNSDNLDKVPVIDGLTIADFDGSSGGFVAVNGCPEPTPTPTPFEPYINALSAIPDYNYTGSDFQLGLGEVVVTLKVNLQYAKKWQYSTDNNNWVVVSEDSNGNADTEVKFKIGPGSYTIHVHGISANGTLGKATTSKDTIQLVVNAPTPTPTQTPTQTPTPTPEPEPTPTPVDCSCTPDGNEKVTITSQNFESDGIIYEQFETGTEIGYDPNGFKNGTTSQVIISFQNGVFVGSITFSGVVVDVNTFYVKTPKDGKCYMGTADNSNRVGPVNNVILTEVELPSDCDPTPTPIPEDCCHGMTEQTNVDSQIQDNGNYVTGESIDVTGTLCWNTFTTKANVGANYTVSFVNDSFEFGGLSINVQGVMDTSSNSSNNIFKFTTTDGVCYEGRLKDPNNINVFDKVN